jgi:processive 1,2-diacylglycerol beta-glucosyltransferase
MLKNLGVSGPTHNGAGNVTRPLRVLILSAEEGEGHRAVARALSADLAASHDGVEIVVRDALEGLGRVIPYLTRDVYRKQLNTSFSWTYGVECNVFARFPPGRAVARGGLVVFGGRPLLRLIRSHDPDVVVSTHPAATSIIGHYRRAGKLEIPALATVSDFGIHPLWAHRGIDLHLVMHESCVRPIEKVAGNQSARVVRPLVQPQFFEPAEQATARRELGLPETGPVVLVSGGGWGVGKLERAVRAARDVQDAHVVCICGLNDEAHAGLVAAFDGEPRARILGYTNRMRDLIAASDVVVHSTGGVTCLEALVLGRPLVAFGVPPGHAKWNAKAHQRLGMGETARTQRELTEALTRAVSAEEAPTLVNGAGPAAGVIVSARPRVKPVSRRRRARPLVVAFTAFTMLFAGWTFASAAPYPLIARFLHVRPMTQVHTTAPNVALVVHAPAALVAAAVAALERRHVRATVAPDAIPGPALRARIDRLGDAPLPVIGANNPAHWISAGRNVRSEARAAGLGSRFTYLVPGSFSLGEEVAARAYGGSAVSGAVRLDSSSASGTPSQGDVVVVDLSGSPRSAVATLSHALSLISASSLTPISLRDLVASGSSREPTGRDLPRLIAPPTMSASAATSAALTHGSPLHVSLASTGARATGTSVVRARTIGAT